MGSPAIFCNSTTDPWPSCSSSLISIRHRPSSTVSVSGMSRIKSRSKPALPPPVFCSSLKSGSLTSARGAACLDFSISSLTSSQPISPSCAGGAPPVSLLISCIKLSTSFCSIVPSLFSLNRSRNLDRAVAFVYTREGGEFLDAFDEDVERVDAVAVEHDDVSLLEVDDLLAAHLGAPQLHDELHPRGHEPFLEPVGPLAVHLQRVALEARLQLLAHGLQHRVGDADGNDARGEFHLDLEVDDDDDVGERHDVGELGIDLGALVADLDIENGLPGLLEIGKRAEHGSLDEAVFNSGKLAAFDLEARLPRSAEEDVHQRKNHLRLDDEDGAAPKRLHPEDVKARRDGKGFQKLAEFHHLDGQRAHPDHPAQKRRQAQPVQAGESLRH